MMKEWGDYLDKLRIGADVIQFKAANTYMQHDLQSLFFTKTLPIAPFPKNTTDSVARL